ncbi:PD-(D/E)XK nuclease-like domain-containing protein [Deltaproteobacteria bacterium TL4]
MNVYRSQHSFKQGIFTGIGFEHYLAEAGLNQTQAKHFLHSQQILLPSPGQLLTPPFLFGNAGHCLLLEPENFDYFYVKAPECFTQRERSSVPQGEAFEAQHQGKTVLPSNVWNQLFNIQKAVKSHPELNSLLNQGQPEVSIFWQDPETRILCKGRMDLLLQDSLKIVDIKFSQSISPSNCKRKIRHYAYDFQAAWYIEGMKQLTHKKFQYVLIFIQNHAPHQIYLRSIDSSDLIDGREQMLQALDYAKNQLKPEIDKTCT